MKQDNTDLYLIGLLTAGLVLMLIMLDKIEDRVLKLETKSTPSTETPTK